MEVTQAGGTQAEPATQPQAGNPPTTTTAPANPPAGADPTTTTTQAANASEQMSLDEAKKLRQEHNTLRKRIAEYEAAQKAADDAKLSETERLQKQAGEYQARTLELEMRVQRQELQLAGFRLASQLGIADIGAALALVQSEHGHDLAFDENTNEPKNLDKLLAQVLKDHPILAAAQAAQPGQPQRPPANSGPAMSPARGQAQPAQTIQNRPLRGWDSVNWKP